MTRFVSGSTTLTFDRNPTQKSGQAPLLRQVSGRDSLGETTVYTKAATGPVAYTLVFEGYNAISAATYEALLDFLALVGVSTPFTYVDYANVSRTVTFAENVIAAKPRQGRYDLSLTVLQEV